MQICLEARPFLPIDLPMVRRLIPSGVSLDPITNLTRGANTMEGAVWGAVPLAYLGTPTFVIRADEIGYVAQFRHKAGDPHAHIVFIAPDLDQRHSESAWLHLLDAMVVAAGRRGAHTLNAEVEESSAAFEVLQQAGFATFARQEIWQRGPTSLLQSEPGLVRPSTDHDTIGIQALYASVVPRLVMQADALPDGKHGGLVFEHQGRIVGYFAVYTGKYGIYVQPFLNADSCADRIDTILAAMLDQLPRADRINVYLCVRRYQMWLREALNVLGFEPCISQAVMVKRTTCLIEHPVFKPAYILDGRVQLHGDGFRRIAKASHTDHWSQFDTTIEGVLDGISDNGRSGKTQGGSPRLSG